MTNNALFDDAFDQLPVMAILRGFDRQRTLEICERAWGLGIMLVEIPVQSEDAIHTLAAAVSAGASRGARVGAGTVTTLERVRRSAEAGAAFTVAPGLSPEVAAASHAAGMPHLPGVATASEVHRAEELGMSWLKAFPASELGAGWISAMHGPFPEARFVATGGVTVTNAETFLAAGAGAVSLGSALSDARQFEELPALVARLRGSRA